MADDAKLRIVIDAVNKASKELGDLKKQLGGVDDEAQKNKKSAAGLKDQFSGLFSTALKVAAGAAAVYLALKKVYDLGKEGAQLDYAAGKFDRLAQAAGTTSDVLIRDLRAAVRGTRSDMDLMTSAGDFLALGLAKTHDEVVRLTKVAGGLNMDMNQLVLTLANKTTMRFDQLGVSVDGFDEKVKKLTESGMAADKAFTEAFLQQAEMQLNRVGNAAETDVGKIARMEAAMENLGNTFKMAVAPAVATVAEGMADAMTAGQRFEDQAKKLNDEFGSGKITLEQYRAQSAEMARQMGYNISVTGDFTKTVSAVGQTTEQVIHANYLLSESQQEIISKWQTAEPVAADMNEQLKPMAENTIAVKDATNDATSAMAKYTDQLLFKIASEGLSAEAALALAQRMGLVDENTVLATEKSAEYKKMLDDGAISLATYIALVDGLNRSIAGLSDKTITVTYNQVTTGTAPSGAWQGVSPGGTVIAQAAGGGANADNAYMWQEHGYRGERFIPSMSGYILSRSDAARALAEAAMGSGKDKGNGSVNINVYGADDPQQTANLIGINFRAARALQGA